MKTLSICAVVAGCFMGVSASIATAAPAGEDRDVGGALAYVRNDHVRADRSGYAAEAWLGTTAGPHWNLEASAQLSDLGGKDNMAVVAADGLYFFDRSVRFAPYVRVGLGYAYEGGLPSTASRGALMTRAGLGFSTDIGARLRLRCEARYQHHGGSGSDTSLTDPMLVVGLSVPLR